MCLFGGLSSSLMAQEVTIGSGTGTTNAQYFPIYIGNSGKYAISQQIYFANEINMPDGGTISQISFYTYNNEHTRNIEIYMANTTKETFSSNTDWVTSATKVFAGNVVFGSGSSESAWIKITLDSSFSYDGTSNLMLCVNDITGSITGDTNYPRCNTFAGGTNTAKYKTGTHITDLSLLSGTTATGKSTRNIIKLNFGNGSSTPTAPTAPTLNSPENNATDIFNPSLSFILGSNTTHYQISIAEASGTGAGDYTNLTSWIEKSSKEDFQTSHLKPATTYYWKVDVKNGEGNDAPTASSESYFTTEAITAAPGAITEVSPTDGASDLENPSLSWKFGENTEEFQLLFGQDPYNLKIVSSGEWENTKNTTELYTYTPSNLSSGTYYWQVKSRNTAGQDTYNTTTGDIYSFSVASIPDDITPIYPTDGATGISNNTTISWTFSSNTKQYRVLYYLTKYQSYDYKTDWLDVDQETFIGSIETSSWGISAGQTVKWCVEVKNSIGGREMYNSGTKKTEPKEFTYTTASILPVANQSPENGTVCTNNPNLTWEYNVGTAKHQILLGTTNPPTEVVRDWSSELSTSYQTSSLTNNTTYYWQVNVKDSNENSADGEVWSFSTLFAPQNVTANPAQVIPTNEGSSTEISWTGQDGANGYNIYIDGNKNNTTLITTTSYVITELAYNPTGHNISVEAVYNSGTSMSNAVNVKVTGFGSLNAIVKDVDTKQVIENALITLTSTRDEFGNENNGTVYELYTDSNGVCSGGNILNGTYAVTVEKEGYITKNDIEIEITNGETTTSSIELKQHLPDNVTPISPADGATEVSSKTIRFTFAPNTTHYRFLYGESAGTLAYCGHGTATTWLETGGATEMEITAPDFETGTTYYWAVDVKNGYGQRTVWNDGEEIAIYSFTTSSISAATNLRNTLNNREVTLTWFYGNGNTVNKYQVLFGTDQNNLEVVQDWTSRGGLSEGSFIKDGLDAGTTYYWQVNVRKDGGDALSSEIASFTTDPLPGAPTLNYPSNNEEITSDPKLSWTFGENTIEYQVLFGTDSDNLVVVQDWTSTLETSYQTSDLSANVTYYWQVNVRNNMGEVQGAVYSFIKSIRPDNVTPISPVHGETGVSNVATITWRFAPNTTHYRFLFDRGYGPEYQIGNNETWVKVTEETASFDTDALGLGALKTYSWAVEVKNDYGVRNYYNGANPSGDVTLYSYTTVNVAAATYQAPANNSVLSTSTAALKWTYGANNTVTHYQVLLGKDNLDVVLDWTEIPTVGTGLGDGTYTTATLTNNTKYYWKVNVKQGVDGTPLEGKVWEFVSLLDIPQNVTTDTVSYDETAHLTWDAIADATSYNIYVDETLYSTVNTNAADIANLVYNGGNAYSIQITAVYEFDGITYESDKSDAVKVTTIGYGMIKVFVKDYKDNRLNGVAITLSGKDIYGNDKEYTFTTNANGTYTSSKPEICEGTYTVTISKDLYFTQTIENVVIVNNATRDLGTIILHSMAIFNVTVINVNADYLDIYLGYDSDNTFNGRSYNIYVWEIHEDTYDPNYTEHWFSIGATQGVNAMYRYVEWKNLPNGIYLIGVELPGSGIINWSNVNAYKNSYIFEKNGNWYNSENWKDGLMPQLPDDQVYIYAEAVVNEGETVTIGNATIKYDNKDYFGSLTIKGEFITTTDIGIVNDSPLRLILNDGAQLRQKNPNLPGKFVMNINNPKVWNEWNKTGWQFIASPFTNAEVSQFTETGDEYDLYKFDGRHENLTVEWRNHKDPKAQFETEFVSGRGYMASYESDTTATLSGTFNSSTSITYPVTYQEIQEGEMHWPNFHLLGNPFTFNMDLSKLQTFHMATGVAVINDAGGWDYLTSGSINVGDGFFVRTVGVNPSVSYSEGSTRSSDNNVTDNISIRISNSTSRDNVVLNFAGADNAGFPKLNAMNEDVAYLYVVDNNERYGIFNYDKDVKEVPLSFEAQKMGNYTISVDAKGEYETIVLVDRQTGIETNMLLEDYKFTATTSKKENTDRFIVRFTFKSDVETESKIFAYQSGDELIIEDEGTVQLFDVTGRMLYISDVKSRGERINVGQLNKAAYILRLVNGEGVKVQKVIIY